MRHYLPFSGPALALAMLGIVFYVYLPKFYVDVYRVPLFTIGIIILASRLWDALIDPLIGVISDRTKAKGWGRRAWIRSSCLPLCAVSLLLLSPPASLSPSGATWWFGFLSILYFLFWSTYSIPYEAWGVELSRNFDERNKLFAFRDGGVVLGTVLSAVLPPLAASFAVLSGIGETPGDAHLVMGLIVASAVVFSTWRLLSRVPEAVEEVSGPRAGVSFSEMYVILRTNMPFRVLLLSYTIGGLGAALPATLILFYVEHVLGSSNAQLYLGLYFVVGFVFIPLWVRLAGRFDKKSAWLLAMSINTLSFLGVLVLGNGDELWYGILVALSAVGYGATLVLPSSMQADVVDYEELRSGEKREGQLIGLWSVSKKMAAALGAAVAFPLLALGGYQEGAAHQTEGALLTLRLLYAGLPSACNLLAIVVALRYPISRQRHREIVSELELRRAAARVSL